MKIELNEFEYEFLKNTLEDYAKEKSVKVEKAKKSKNGNNFAIMCAEKLIRCANGIIEKLDSKETI